MAAGYAYGQGAPRLRHHTATQARALSLKSANRSVAGGQVSIVTRGSKRIMTANGIPTHPVAPFPNSGNPNRISAQNYRFEMPLSPRKGAARATGRSLVGVAVNGVPFDPGAAEFWQGDRNSGWQYEALGGAVTLGLDANYGHVQPTGAYHYHGLPIGLLQQLGWSKNIESPLVGWAADGFPIYAMTSVQSGKVVQMRSSYQLKSGNRPGGNQPGGRHDGTFVQDYVHVAGTGNLDECNGAIVKTADYPDGTYAYFLTSAFPVIPRMLRGSIDSSFKKRGGGNGGGLRPPRQGQGSQQPRPRS
ncbi:hypothetical protein ACMU_18755 [Actibacterium mucosum KCTC 23349]|uniref:YHYH domain-containing protein n=1 Tax=Actibacterium mucosum KCTC 23349 TaxID=1454373 RepID=A0A037ZFF1_9RHOB|nr:hypothetical protein ACMU_18755 [Actibacterium mucosum KCTC 23349]